MLMLAYIDPGSGSMLIQVLLAGILAVPFFFRRVIADTVARFRRGGGDPQAPASAAPSDTTEDGHSHG